MECTSQAHGGRVIDGGAATTAATMFSFSMPSTCHSPPSYAAYLGVKIIEAYLTIACNFYALVNNTALIIAVGDM